MLQKDTDDSYSQKHGCSKQVRIIDIENIGSVYPDPADE